MWTNHLELAEEIWIWDLNYISKMQLIYFRCFSSILLASKSLTVSTF